MIDQGTAPVTRQEYHLDLMVVWLFVVLVSIRSSDAGQRWTALLVPVAAIVMIFLHGRAYRRAVAASARGTG
jgi:hypothetical protein